MGYFLVRSLADPILGFLLATGAGGMLYLTVMSLLPEAEEYHYQKSAALALAAGSIAIFAPLDASTDLRRARGPGTP